MDTHRDRNLFGLFKDNKDNKLSEDEIQHLMNEIVAIGADPACFRFNERVGIGFIDHTGLIYIDRTILNTQDKIPPKYRLSVRGILAHEYWGHLKNHPSPFEPNAPEDECWADDSAARRSLGLSDEERTILFRRALRHAQVARAQKGVGHTGFVYKLDDVIRRYVSHDEIRELNG